MMRSRRLIRACRVRVRDLRRGRWGWGWVRVRVRVRVRVSHCAPSVSKFARETRDYLRAYATDGGKTDTHSDVEKLRGTFKSHRSSLDFDFKFIRDA